MSLPDVTSREQWLAARKQLLAKEKELTRLQDAFGRGTERNSGTYSLLDITALGRQEEWEEPKGRAGAPREAVPDFAE